MSRRAATVSKLSLVVALAACAFALPAPASAAAASGPVTALDSLEGAVIYSINRTRAARGLVRLRAVPRLTNAATRHANSMGSTGYMSHDLWTPRLVRDWTPFGSWIRWYWPGSGYRSWSAGENLFCSSYRPSAGEVVRAWMNSPTHRANLLNRGWRNIGVSAVQATPWVGAFQGCTGNVTLVAAEFGRRSS